MRCSIRCFLPLLAACGGAVVPSTSSTPAPDRESTEPTTLAWVAPAPRSLPAPVAELTSRLASHPGIPIRLADGRYLLPDRHVALLLDDDLRIVGSVPLPGANTEVLGELAHGRGLLVDAGTVDLRTGTLRRPDERTRFVGRTADGMGTLRGVENGTRPEVLVERADGRGERSRFVLDLDALLARLPESEDEESDEIEDEESDEDRVEERAEEGGAARDEPATAYVYSARIDGPFLAVMVSVDDRDDLLCSIRVEGGEVVACSEVGRDARIVDLDGTSGFVCVEDQRETVCLSLTDLSRVESRLDAAGNFRIRRLDVGTVRIETSDGRVLVERVDDRDVLAVTGDRVGYRVGSAIRIVDAAGTVSEWADHPGAQEFDRRWSSAAFVGPELFVDVEGSIARFRPGTREVAGLVSSPNATWTSNGVRLELRAGNVISLGVDGLAIAARLTGAVENPWARRLRLLPDANPDAIAVPHPTTPGIALALVEAGNVRIVDDAGRDVVPAIRLPRAVARSGCSELEFVTDVDLALHGSAPCIPTRIRFRVGRTEPLGRAYVDVSRTPDGSKVLLLANRRVRLLDGRTGATIVDVGATVDHLRSVWIASDGHGGMVRGSESSAGFRFERDLVRVVVVPEFEDVFDAENTLTVRCADGRVEFRDPFVRGAIEDEAEEPEQVMRSGQAHACSSLANEYSRTFTFISGFAGVQSGMYFSIVRLRDLRLLEFAAVAGPDGVSLALLDGDSVVALAPADSASFGVRSAESTDVVALVGSGGDVAAAVREFFAAP